MHKNENRPGYKKTKVGWIPEGWEETQLRELGHLSKGNGISKDELSAGGVPCIRYGEIYTVHDFVLKEFHSFISPSLAAQSVRIRKNDLLFAGSGETAEEIGKSVAYMNAAEAYAGGDVILLSVQPTKGRADYLSYYLNTVGRKALNRLGQGQSVVHIYPKNLAHMQIPLPPLPEQVAIAEVLGCWDRGIRNLELKIVKKRLIKKGLMQKLLSGQIRLPGFSNDWKNVKLGSVAKMSSGGTPKSTISEYYGGGILWASISDMTACGMFIDWTERTLTEAGIQNSAAKVFPAGTVLFAMYASIGESCITKAPMATSQAILGITPHEILSNKFLYRCLCLNKEKIKLQGQSGTQSNLNAQMVKDIKIPLPPLEEQRAIAEVLAAADGELEALERKLALWKDQKKFLLNNLVTGTIRLPAFAGK